MPRQQKPQKQPKDQESAAAAQNVSGRDPDILRVEDVAKLFNIPVSTVRYLAKDGRIPGKKIGRQWRFRRSEVERWWAERD